MRKLRELFLCAVLSVLGGHAFAARQTSVCYTLGGTKFKAGGDFEDVTISYGFSPFGIVCTNQWLGGADETGKFNVGFDLSFGLWASFSQERGGYESDDWVNIGEYLSIGPVFRYCIVNNNSILLTPGIQVNIDEGIYTGSVNWKSIALSAAFSLDIAYRWWFSDTSGLTLGFGMDFPFVGTFMDGVTANGETYTRSGSVGSGFAYKILIGYSFR